MSDAIFDDPEFEDDLPQSESELEPDTVGQTSGEQPVESSDQPSAETSDDAATEPEEEPSKKKISLSVFDAMLLVSLICVSLATLLLVLELRRIDPSFPFGYPWATSEVMSDTVNLLIYR